MPKFNIPFASIIAIVVLFCMYSCATSPSVQLHMAIKDGSYSNAKQTIDRNGPELNMCNLLEKSISSGRADFVSFALRDGASSNCTASSDVSMLYTAVALKCRDCAKALISAGARINDSGKAALGQTPLDTAYITGDRELIQFMSSRGAIRHISDAQVAQTKANIQKSQMEVDEDPAPAQAYPSFSAAAMPIMPAYPSIPSVAKQPQENRQAKGFERTYCVQASLLRNDSPSANTLHIKFVNSCPIAVIVGWSAKMPDGALQGGEASGAILPGGTYNTFSLYKGANGVRHIACSAKAPGFRAVPSETDWYCSPGGD